MSTKLGLSCMAAVVLAGAVFLGGGARVEAGDAFISCLYPAEPEYQLPEAVKCVSVTKPGYLDRARDSGLMQDYTDRWYRVLFRRLEERFGSAAPHIRVLDREDAIVRDDEKRRAGISEDSRDVDPTVFMADAQIVPRFGLEYHSERIRVKKSLVQIAVNNGISKIPIVGPSLNNPSEYEYIERITVAVYCDIKLQYTKTGVAAVTYSDVLVNYEQTESGILDIGRKNATDLEPVQQVIDRLIQEHVDAFLSRFLPIERHLKAQFKSDKEVREAVVKLNAGNLQGAMIDAWKYFRNKNNKVAEAAFVVGVVWELRGDHHKSRDWYNTAYGLRNQEMAFKIALDRQNRRIETMRNTTNRNADSHRFVRDNKR